MWFFRDGIALATDRRCADSGLGFSPARLTSSQVRATVVRAAA